MMRELLIKQICQALTEECLYEIENYFKRELPSQIHSWLDEFEPNFKVPITKSKQVLYSYIERCHAFVFSKIEESYQEKTFHIEHNILIPHMAYWIKSTFDEFYDMDEDQIVGEIQQLQIDIPINYIKEPYSYRIGGVAPILYNGWITSITASLYVMRKGSKIVLKDIKERMEQAYSSYFQAHDLRQRFKDEIFNSTLKALYNIVKNG